MPLLNDSDRRSPNQQEEEMADDGAGCPSFWLEAPDSILLHIFSFLTIQELGQVCQTCKTWHRISSDESIWRSILQTRLKLVECKLPQGKLSWRHEVKRLHHLTPTVLTETLVEHTDEVLHVSFSHNGSMFSTTSKDASLKVWDVGYPTQLKHSKDFRELLGWDFTQFSCFNESDTMVLVSSVKTSPFLDRRGYMAVLSLVHDFDILRVVTMDPSHLFGAWLDDTTFLGGSLQISLDRFTTTVQIEAYDVPEVFSPMPLPAETPFVEESLGRPLFTFSSETASLIKFLTVAAFSPVDNGTQPLPQTPASSQQEEEEEETRPFTELTPNIHKCFQNSASCLHNGHIAEPVTNKPVLDSSVTLQSGFEKSLTGNMEGHGSDSAGVVCDWSSRNTHMQGHGSGSLENEMKMFCGSSLVPTTEDGQIESFSVNSDLKMAFKNNTGNLCSFCMRQSMSSSLADSGQDSDKNIISVDNSCTRVPEAGAKHCDASNRTVGRPQSLDISKRSKLYPVCSSHSCNRSITKSDLSPNSMYKCSGCSSECRSPGNSDQGRGSACMDLKVKNLIFLTGEFAVALHQLGFKNVSAFSPECLLSAGQTPMEEDSQEGYMVVNYSNNDIHIVRRLQETDRPDSLIDLSGHVTGMCLTPDQRYLFFNCRPWIGDIDRSDPWATPDLSGNIEVRMIDLLTLKDVGVRYTGHKGFSTSNMCCFVFLDVSEDYVASGSEDTQGYLWDRHYKTLLANYQHASGVVNAVGFNPMCQEYLVTVSDDGTIKVWRSKQEVRRLNIPPVSDDSEWKSEEDS